MRDLLDSVCTQLLESDSDAEYLSSVKAKDTRRLSGMVSRAARERGYLIGPVHHGTSAEFNEFRTQGLDPVVIQFMGRTGAFFTEDMREARMHSEEASLWKGGSPRVASFYLKIESPVGRSTGKKTAVGYYDAKWERIQAEVRRKGADGVIVTDPHEKGHRIFTVFSPSQIKSSSPVTYDDQRNVIPLSSRFDPSSNDVRF